LDGHQPQSLDPPPLPFEQFCVQATLGLSTQKPTTVTPPFPEGVWPLLVFIGQLSQLDFVSTQRHLVPAEQSSSDAQDARQAFAMQVPPSAQSKSTPSHALPTAAWVVLPTP
jgi:hypothetical protein